MDAHPCMLNVHKHIYILLSISLRNVLSIHMYVATRIWEKPSVLAHQNSFFLCMKVILNMHYPETPAIDGQDCNSLMAFY